MSLNAVLRGNQRVGLLVGITVYSRTPAVRDLLPGSTAHGLSYVITCEIWTFAGSSVTAQVCAYGKGLIYIC